LDLLGETIGRDPVLKAGAGFIGLRWTGGSKYGGSIAEIALLRLSEFLGIPSSASSSRSIEEPSSKNK